MHYHYLFVMFVKMLGAFSFFLACLSVGMAANRVDPPTKVIKLTLGVSKATYLPLSPIGFIKGRHIIENPSASRMRKVKIFFGITILRPPKYDSAEDKSACSIAGWTAKGYKKEGTELLKFQNAQQKLVVFGFRGTEPKISDWLKNFLISPMKSSIYGTTFTTHEGFKKRYNSIAAWFEREYSAVPRDYTIVLTGHSLGGALTTIAAVYAAGKLKRKPDAVVTYGSPLVGAQDFKNYYNQVVGCDRTIRMTAKSDPFINVPKVHGYTHVCDEENVDGTPSKNPHGLYDGYERGIKVKYRNDINFGCGRVLD